MNLYHVTNGFMGNGYCYVIVIAKNEKIACELASVKYKENSTSERYWTNLKAELLHEDTSKEYASEVSD